MPVFLDPREVLAYLNELGYQNITAQQLKEFMTDLKKLIKYETRRQRADRENASPRPPSRHDENLAPNHLTPTESSKAKQVSKKDTVVSVHIRKPTRCPNAPNCIYTKEAAASQVSSGQPKESPHVHKSANEIAGDESQTRPKSCDIPCEKPKAKVTFKSNVLRPRGSYIVPKIPTKKCKCDPVALYHKYEEEWKKYKLPGEDNHSNLRWVIRERLLGQPRCNSRAMSAAPSMEVIARKRVATARI